MAPEPPEDISRDERRGVMTATFLADSEDSEDEYEGYSPLPLAPLEESDLRMWTSELVSPDTSDDEQFDAVEPVEEITEPVEEIKEPVEVITESVEEITEPVQSSSNVPSIETVDQEVTREVWTQPREAVNIEMDSVKAQEVISAMANFTLPPSSFPEWAQCISEDEWRQQLAKRINITQENR